MRLLAFFFALALATAPLAVRADDAPGLLAKHKAFAGWQAGDGSFSQVVRDGTVTYEQDGQTKTTTQVHSVRLGLAFRTTSKSVKYGTSSDDGFTGNLFWETNRNGFVHPVIGDALKYAISEELLFNEAFTTLPGTVKGSDTVDGVACTNVQVRMDAAFPINVCIEPQTGELKRATIDPGGSYENTIDILAYSAAGGKKLVSQWRYKGSKYTHRWSTIKTDVAVTAEMLHPPAQTATWQFNSGRPFPIEFEHNDVARGIYINATINGAKGRFLMDTGASEIVLNRSFTGRVHLKPLYASAASGIGGVTQTEVQKVDTIEIGGNKLSNVIVSTFNYDLLNGKENGEELDGIIGFDLFGGAVVNLDLDAQQMTLYDPANSNIDMGSGVPLNVDLDSLQPMIPMKINGTIPIRAILDSGNLMAKVTMSYDMANRYGLRMAPQGMSYASGVGGISEMECGELDTLSIGPIVYQNAPACRSRDFEDNWAIVGFDFLEHFNMVFDYPQGRLLLLPRKDGT